MDIDNDPGYIRFVKITQRGTLVSDPSSGRHRGNDPQVSHDFTYSTAEELIDGYNSAVATSADYNFVKDPLFDETTQEFEDTTIPYGSWISIELPEMVIVHGFILTAKKNNPEEAPSDFILYGSNDSGTPSTNHKWTQLFSITNAPPNEYLDNQASHTGGTYYDVNATAGFKHYCLVSTKVNGGNWGPTISELQFIATKYDPKAILTIKDTSQNLNDIFPIRFNPDVSEIDIEPIVFGAGMSIELVITLGTFGVDGTIFNISPAQNDWANRCTLQIKNFSSGYNSINGSSNSFAWYFIVNNDNANESPEYGAWKNWNYSPVVGEKTHIVLVLNEDATVNLYINNTLYTENCHDYDMVTPGTIKLMNLITLGGGGTMLTDTELKTKNPGTVIHDFNIYRYKLNENDVSLLYNNISNTFLSYRNYKIMSGATSVDNVLLGQIQDTGFPREGDDWRYNSGSHVSGNYNVEYICQDLDKNSFIVGIINGDAVNGKALKMCKIDIYGNHIPGSNRMVTSYAFDDLVTESKLLEEYHRPDYTEGGLASAIKNDNTGDQWWTFTKGALFESEIRNKYIHVDMLGVPSIEFDVRLMDTFSFEFFHKVNDELHTTNHDGSDTNYYILNRLYAGSTVLNQLVYDVNYQDPYNQYLVQQPKDHPDAWYGDTEVSTSIGTWVHIVITYDRINSEIKYYINGTEYLSGTEYSSVSELETWDTYKLEAVRRGANVVNDVDHIDYDGNSDHSYKYRLHPNVVLNQSEISSMVRSQTNIDNLGLQQNITFFSITADSVDHANTTATIYVSFLTTEGNDILVDQELCTGIEQNETKIKTFSLPELRDNIQVKLYTTNIDGFALSEVQITYKYSTHTFTTVNNTDNSGNGVNNTVGWFDFGTDAVYPNNRIYTI